MPVSAPSITSGIDTTLVKGGSISGKVTDSADGAPPQSILVSAVDAATGNGVASAYTDSTGVYNIKGLASGNYKVRINNYSYSSRWFPNSADADVATVVTVAAPDATTGIDITVTKGGSISGTIEAASCPAPGSFSVMAYDVSTGKQAGRTWVNPEYSSKFEISGLPSGSYKVEVATSGTDFVRQWYSDKPDMTSADIVTVTAPDTINGIEIQLVRGGSITGKLTDSSGNAIRFITVKAYDALSDSIAATARTDYAGNYSLRGLPAGSYKIQFAGSFGFVGQWYKTQADLPDASVITLSVSATVTGIDAVLTKLSPIPLPHTAPVPLPEPVSPDPDPPPAISVPPVRGDLNGDGKTDVADALVALQISVGLVTPTVYQTNRGDVAPLVNGTPSPDGVVDIADAMLILKKAVGLVNW